MLTMGNFMVIEIVDDTHPYPSLLGIDLDFDNQVIIHLKRIKMIFEGGDIRVFAPLDP